MTGEEKRKTSREGSRFGVGVRQLRGPGRRLEGRHAWRPAASEAQLPTGVRDNPEPLQCRQISFKASPRSLWAEASSCALLAAGRHACRPSSLRPAPSPRVQTSDAHPALSYSLQ